jgi:hypothetical protein
VQLLTACFDAGQYLDLVLGTEGGADVGARNVVGIPWRVVDCSVRQVDSRRSASTQG